MKPLLAFVCTTVFSATVLAQNLTLDSYLEQVKSKNTGYRGSVERAQGAKLHSEEGNLLTMPSFFANGTWFDNQLESTNSFLTGNRQIGQNFSTGFQETTPFGLQAKLYYNLNYTSISGIPTLPAPFNTLSSASNYYEGKPVLELTQSLWKNGFGRETRANQEAINAAARATQFTEQFTSESQLIEAESSYWRLSMARELLTLQDESYNRAAKLRDWSQKRSKMQLADRSDLLQASSALKLRELDRQSAFEEERNAARQFNSLRGVDSDQVSEKLNPMPSDVLIEAKLAGTRGDIKALEESMKAAAAAARASKEKNRPTLDVFANLSKNAIETEQSEALSKSMSEYHPSAAVGVMFKMPLDIATMNRTIDGYQQEAAASELKLERRLFEQEKERNDLKFKLAETKKRMKMAQQFEEAQKEKYFYEKERHSHGRTTTFLVLQFEQDLALAQLNRLKVQTELLALVSQTKLYGGAQ